MASNKLSITVIYGLTAGFVLIGYTLMLYHFGVDAYLGNWARAGYLVIFALAASAAIAEKKMHGGYLDFRAALKAAYTVIVLSLALQSLVTWVLMNYIDVPFRQAVEVEVLKADADWWKRLGYPQGQIDKMLADQRGQNQYTPKNVLQGLMISYVIGFLPALLIAVIVKKKKQ